MDRKFFLFLFFEFLVSQNSFAVSSLFSIYRQNDHYMMCIPDSIIDRDILVSTTILQGAARKTRSIEMRFGYGGDAVFSKMISLVKKANKIEITAPEPFLKGNQMSIYQKYEDSLPSPILFSFSIQAQKKNCYIIDVTDFLKDDNALVSLKGAKEELKLGTYILEQSYLIDVKSYSQNVNFRSFRTYASSDPSDPTPTSWVVGVSWFLLPKQPMKPRLVDDRVGYFSTKLKGSVFGPYENGEILVSNRWRLEPRLEDMDKYRRGELVEPRKQIVYYIDRDTPAFLVPYFINAVEVWNKAFECAGFKNAIVAKLAPTEQEDSTYSEDDMRYSLISYKASPIPNAYGPMVIDPRSGEVLNSHVAIFYSVLQLLQRWYFVMCGASDPDARQYPLPKDVMGRLAGMVVTHEVGHTLGLLHNFAGSTAYSPENLRDVNFVRKNGIGASVMDYQRFDYVAQPGDGFHGTDFLPRLGVYDRYAIEWGYRLFPDSGDIVKENLYLKNWVTKHRAADKRLFFLPETDLQDPRIQSEDCSNDQITANVLCIKNLKIDMNNLEKWNPRNDDDNFVLKKRYLSILSHYDNCMGHILKFIGGRYTDNPDRGEMGNIYTPVSKETQKRAMDFLTQYVFREPRWLFNRRIMEKTQTDFSFYADKVYSALIGKLVYKSIALDQNTQIAPGSYSSKDMLEDMERSLFFEKGTNLSDYDRKLQNAFVTQLSISAENGVYFLNGYSALAKQIMMRIQEYSRKIKDKSASYIDKAHFQAINDFISVWRTGGQKVLLDTNNSLK